MLTSSLYISVVDAIDGLENSVAAAGKARAIPIPSVSAIRERPREPAIVTTPVIRYLDNRFAACNSCSVQQLQRGRKIWFVANGRRNLTWFLRSRRRDLVTWAGEVERGIPDGVFCHVQRVGDAVYLPPGCAHAVFASEPSTLLSFHIALPESLLGPRTQAALRRVVPDSEESDEEFERPSTQGSSKSKKRPAQRPPKRTRRFCRDNSRRPQK